MCFSAEASVAAGVVLLPAGVYSTVAAVRKNRTYLPLAITPVLFALQQFCEGGVWVGLGRNDPAVVRPFALAFLFFAVALWPGWMPLTAGLLERSRRRGWMFAASAVGLVLGMTCYLPAALHADEWLVVQVVGHSVQYDLSAIPLGDTPVAGVFQWAYLALVCVPLLTTRDVWVRVLGVSVAVSAVVAFASFRYAFASVWCFFAAVISAQICHILYRVPAKATAAESHPVAA